MKKTQNQLLHLNAVLQENLSLSISECFKEGIDIWKKYWSSFLGFVLVFMISNIIFDNIPYLGKMLNLFLFTPVLTLGAAIVSSKIDQEIDFKFGAFFSGFKFSWDIFLCKVMEYLTYFILILPALACSGLTGIYSVSGGIQDLTTVQWSATHILALLALLPLFFLYISFFYGVMIIGFFNMDAFNALKFSLKLVKRNWFKIFFLIFLLGMFSVCGIIGLGLGILVTVSMYFPLLYVSFKKITKFDSYLMKN